MKCKPLKVFVCFQCKSLSIFCCLISLWERTFEAHNPGAPSLGRISFSYLVLCVSKQFVPSVNSLWSSKGKMHVKTLFSIVCLFANTAFCLQGELPASLGSTCLLKKGFWLLNSQLISHSQMYSFLTFLIESLGVSHHALQLCSRPGTPYCPLIPTTKQNKTK